jgi:hypothetical protein
MALSTGMTRALARSPGLFVSTVLTCMVGALLPPLAGSALFYSGLALMGVLCVGALERPAVRLLSRARALSEAEAAALAPALALLRVAVIAPLWHETRHSPDSRPRGLLRWPRSRG